MKVLILGAGVIGTTSAYYLAKAGHEVTFIDRQTGHALVTSFGNASFGDRTQAQSLQTPETCRDCHAPGVFMGLDIVHGQK